MTHFDEQLQILRQQISRKQHLKAMLQEWYSCETELLDRVCILKDSMMKEQSDVERLEGHSLASLFYQAVGRMDEKMDQERQEAYAAKVKYDAAAKELEAVQADIQRAEDELSSLDSCEECYTQLLAAKKAAVKAAGGEAAEQILRLEERISELRSRSKELREAISAGNSALNTADSIQSSLDSADSWATWDLLGGGMLTDMAKHSHLDDAQVEIERLQVQLRRFKTELADVSLSSDIQISIDGFLRFADYFFDGLFADWAVKEKIAKSKGQVDHTIRQLENVLRKLEGLLSSTEQYESQTKDEIDQLVLHAADTAT